MQRPAQWAGCRVGWGGRVLGTIVNWGVESQARHSCRASVRDACGRGPGRRGSARRGDGACGWDKGPRLLTARRWRFPVGMWRARGSPGQLGGSQDQDGRRDVDKVCLNYFLTVSV